MFCQGVRWGRSAAGSDGRGFLHLRLWRLRKALAKGAEFDEFRRLELRITSAEVRQGLIEPLLLVIRVTPDDATLHDLLEQLVAAFLVGRVHHGVPTRTKLGLSHFLWVVVYLRNQPERPASMRNLTAKGGYS